MESVIENIISLLDQLGAGVSTGPIRECITGLEGRIQALETERAQLQQTIAAYAPNFTIAIDEATAPLRAQIAALTQAATDTKATTDAQAEATQATIAARDAQIAALQARLDAINAILNPPPTQE